MRRVQVLLLLALLAVAPTASADLITNGSFESGRYGGGAYQTLGAPDSSILGWTVTSGSIDWIESYWQASDGSRSIDLNGLALGAMSISTPLATAPGQQYLLTFDLAGNPDSGPVVKTLDVVIGNQVQSFAFDTTGKSRGNMGWAAQNMLFTAAGADTLSFVSTTTQNGPYYGPALDNVRLTAVPEPASLLLLGTGLIGAVRAVRRKRA